MPKPRSGDPRMAVAYVRVSTDTDRQALGAEAQRVAGRYDEQQNGGQNEVAGKHVGEETQGQHAALDERAGKLNDEDHGADHRAEGRRQEPQRPLPPGNRTRRLWRRVGGVPLVTGVIVAVVPVAAAFGGAGVGPELEDAGAERPWLRLGDPPQVVNVPHRRGHG